MSKVVLQDVVKRFAQLEVIHNVDLEIDEGTFCVFVGPSGCGKSTLLRMIAGLEETTGGNILIGSSNVTHADPAKRGVAMVFQTYALYPHMTVKENMSFGLRMAKVDKTEIEAKVLSAANILKLTPYLNRKPKALSGGQRQRVAIGRAIVRNPKVFLFDEPLSNLDAELRVQMRLEIARLHKELGATMIYVTHDQVEAMTMADKIVVLRDGRVEQHGSPMSLYEDPDNQFVAGFIGSPRMNFLDATVVSQGGGATVVELTDFLGVQVPMPVSGTYAVGTPVVLGIRPEHFTSTGSVKLELAADVTETLGGVSYIYSQPVGNSAPLTVEFRDGQPPKGGLALKTGFNPMQARLFDKATGVRIR